MSYQNRDNMWKPYPEEEYPSEPHTTHIRAVTAIEALPAEGTDFLMNQNTVQAGSAKAKLLQAWQLLLDLGAYAQADAVLEVGRAIFGRSEFMRAVSGVVKSADEAR